VAPDLVVSPGGRGGAVLDGYGTVHVRGDAPTVDGSQIRDSQPHWRGLAVEAPAYILVRGA